MVIKWNTDNLLFDGHLSIKFVFKNSSTINNKYKEINLM